MAARRSRQAVVLCWPSMRMCDLSCRVENEKMPFRFARKLKILNHYLQKNFYKNRPKCVSKSVIYYFKFYVFFIGVICLPLLLFFGKSLNVHTFRMFKLALSKKKILLTEFFAGDNSRKKIINFPFNLTFLLRVFHHHIS